MITNDTLMYFKEQYNGHKIIYVRYSNEDFIFRTLNKKEYKYAKSTSNGEYELNDRICNMSALYPDDFDADVCGYAGLPDYVASIIETESGFADINYILEDYYIEKERTNLEAQCMDVIKAFIPEYTYEEMEDWTWQKLMTMTARAERVAALKGYDFSLINQAKEIEEEYNKLNSSNKDFINQLYEYGVDPMFHFQDELNFQNDIIDLPFILGNNHNEEVTLNEIRKQINKKETRATN